MSVDPSVAKFNAVADFDDSQLESIELKIGLAECQLSFGQARLVDPSGSSPSVVYKNARLKFFNVESVVIDGSIYRLNSTVVGYGAVPANRQDLIEYYFDLTGGREPETFLVRLRIFAQDFAFGPGF